MSKNKLIFFGNEKLASGVSTDAPILSSLIAEGWNIAHVVINQSEITSRSQRDIQVERVASDNGISLLKPNHLSDIHDVIIASGAEVGILAAYGKILPQEILDLFKFGVLNLHPSLLPHYRGSTPIESVILNGDRMTGISLMKLVHEMDAGQIFGFSELELSGKETKQQLYDQLSELGSKLLLEMLPKILDKSVQAAEQDHAQATYCNAISKTDGQVDWNKSAEQIEREVRAYQGWPGTFTTIHGYEFIVTKAAVTDGSGKAGLPFKTTDGFAIYCGEKALAIKRLKPQGKQEMDGKSFLNGARDFIKT